MEWKKCKSKKLKWKKYIYIVGGCLRHLHLVILQMFLSKATYNWGIHKAINLEEANRQSARNNKSQALFK